MLETRTWNGPAYDRVSMPMERLGREVMDRLELRGDETVLDAGCGSGRLTELLIERVPRGHVIGVDASASMIDAARERLGEAADLRRADLVGLDLGGEQVDVVFSTATFHWIADHAALFRSLRAALRPGGRLVAQCGGAGNVESVHGAAAAAGEVAPFAAHFAGWQGPWNFAAPQASARRAAGWPSGPSRRTTRARSCARSSLARTSTGCRRTSTTLGSMPCSSASASARRS